MTARPPLTAGELHDDWAWFKGTRRRYRLRRTADGCWIVRRRAGGVLLRVWAPTLPISLPDTDESIRPYWFATAWPELPAAKRAELIKEARQLEHG